MKIKLNGNNDYGSLGDIYAKYSILGLNDNGILDLVDGECFNFLSYKVNDPIIISNCFSYTLKYDKSGDIVTIKPDNILCALWFIGVFPANYDKVLQENYFENQNNIYTFDKRSRKLKIKEK